MEVEIMPLGMLQTNCYLVYKGKEALIIDPGDEAEKVINFLTQNELTPQAILLTHAHFDHIDAVDDLRRHYNIDVYLHEAEAKWLEDPSFSGSASVPRTLPQTNKPDHFLEPGELTIGNFSFNVKHTPGHSPGSSSFIFHQEQKVFSGDVLFKQGVGRTDLRGGDTEELLQSIRGSLYALDEAYTVYPGHGETFTIGYAKQSHPYVPEI